MAGVAAVGAVVAATILAGEDTPKKGSKKKNAGGSKSQKTKPVAEPAAGKEKTEQAASPTDPFDDLDYDSLPPEQVQHEGALRG